MRLICHVCLICGAPNNASRNAPKGAVQDLFKGAQKSAPEILQKGALQAALELHLFMQFSMYKR